MSSPPAATALFFVVVTLFVAPLLECGPGCVPEEGAYLLFVVEAEGGGNDVE